jgi:hypothetical protein
MTTSRKQRPTFLQAMAISGAGLLIALFGCFGAISGFSNNGNTNLGEIGLAGFILGILMFIVGGILLLVVIIRPFFSKQQPAAPADNSSPGPSAPPASPGFGSGPAEGE